MSLRSSMMNRTKGQKLDAEYGWMDGAVWDGERFGNDGISQGWDERCKKVRMYN